MRIISVKVLREFWERHEDAEGPLQAWYHEAKHAEWQTTSDIRERYPSADVVNGNRIIFNIKGNAYRLIVVVHFNCGRLYIRFVGTHAEYDRIDAKKV